ncbi:YceI family protein [Parapusillimonas granuli]|uniref:Polyisoprenoid-binding protein n=1 Tax=Parapusillimonas granuli TaxID=380911 RepID=A0A853G1P2_9BURK|nr:YceI family protein [Parapusillimonas granuli]MBB5215541.1 polyisoprenoid-binding protein YceI [Parapusillimonas granuli]MEB2401104.1 YceI family protein [Alcaligenaceae bacterium]NYT49792.1 polyisoprenoid-binding protein [Parapusillimonas granuli]
MKKALFAAAILAASGLAHAQEAIYDVEPTHAFVHFEVLHSGTSTNRGRFDTVEGTVTLDKAGRKGKVDVVVRPGSVNTGIESYNDHLRNADFLNVPVYPTARFVGDGFIFEDGRVKSVSGMLTLLGKTQPVTLNALRFNCYDNPRAKKEACGGDFETMLKRSDFGMTFGLPGIPDEVRILIQIEALKR